MERHEDGGSIAMPSSEGVAILGVQQARSDASRPAHGDTVVEPYGRQPMMLNLRVTDMEAIVKVFQDAGDSVAGPRAYEGMGKFAWVRTPDGHDVELWEMPKE